MGRLVLLLLIVFLVKNASGGSVVTTLPGYTGDLPFTLQTGYVGVDENEVVQLFYYFVESQGNPSTDPLLLWINGGPGCSGLASFLFESGPLTLDTANYVEGTLPTLLLNPYAWTKNLNIIYLDAPVGTGFSYATTADGYNVGDTKFATHTYEFLQKWLTENALFLANELYIGGEGYSGTPLPLVVQEILNGNQDTSKITMNITGYVIGNPGTDNIIDFNARTTFAHRLALIPDELYGSAYIHCNGNFTTDTPSAECSADNAEIYQLISEVNPTNILQPSCNTVVPAATTAADDINLRRSLKEKFRDFFYSHLTASGKECPDYAQSVCESWANDESVQEALHVQVGTISSWLYCNDSLNQIYTHDVSSVVDYHRNFSQRTDLQALIYSGDHDMGVSYIGTLEWIKSLKLPLVGIWRAWSVDGEVAGYTKKFSNNDDYNLTFATVKGGGHFAAEDNMKECFKMVDRWMSTEPL